MLNQILEFLEDIVLTDDVETLYEKQVTFFGNSAKVDVPKKHIDKRAHVVTLRD